MSIEYFRDIEQGTEEWLKLRLGKITASIVKQLVTNTMKVADNDKSRAIVYELAAERITGHLTDRPQTFDMVRGHIEEELARDLYSENYSSVEECGFITNDEYGFTIGFSPDGLVGEDGIIEIKSRIPKFQIQTFCLGSVPGEYMLQIQTGLLVTGREWCDFIQYSNGMPLFVKRVKRDVAVMEKIILACRNTEAQIKGVISTFLEKSYTAVISPRVDVMNGDDDITTGE